MTIFFKRWFNFSSLTVLGIGIVLSAGLWLEISELPGQTLCLFRRIFEKDCPGCGLTRSFLCIAKGDLKSAWFYHPGGLFLYLFFLSIFFVEIYKVITGRMRESNFYYQKVTPWYAVGLISFFLIFWLYRFLQTL